MFGINKNGTKHKIGIIMPAFFPAARTTYDGTTSGLSATDVQGAIDAVVPLTVHKKTVKLTTDANGQVFGATSALFGVADASILHVYFEKDSFNAMRQVSLNMYGGAGYYLTFTHTSGGNEVPIANSDVHATFYYMVAE